jgi:putative hydrolase of the HAD superfamily
MAARIIAKPKAVLFDLFHTLVFVPPAGGEYGPQMGETLGIPHLHDELMRRFHDDDVLGRCFGRVRDPREVIRCLATDLNPVVSEEQIDLALRNRRRRFRHALVSVEPGILDALDELKNAGIHTALVSDAGFDDVEFWSDSPLATRFKTTIFSYEVGVRKPDRRIYEHALAGLGVSPEGVLFVGDGGSDEHRGARVLGMGTVLITRIHHKLTAPAVQHRRAHADWQFEDVPSFVEALGLNIVAVGE